MKILLITTALFTASLVGTVMAQTTTSTLNDLVSEQERQIQELTTEVSSLRSLLSLERRKNLETSLPVASKQVSKTSSHTVKAGDTFSSISRKYGVSVSSLIRSNPNVKPSRIAISEKLVIPQMNFKAISSSPELKAIPTTTANLTNSSTQSVSTKGSTYKISKGDTFYSVAKKHKISLASLSAANPGVNPSKLKIGQIISLTESATQSTKTTPSNTTPTKKPTSAYKPLPEVVKVVQEATPAKPAPKSKPTVAYVQQSDDVARTVPVSHEMTFGAFAKQHGTSITALNVLNGLDLPADEPMAAGSELFIPIK